MSAPVPAHGATPGAAAPTDYTEVGAAEYAAAVQAQQAAAAPAPASMTIEERPPADPGQHTADLRAEVETELDRADQAADPAFEYPEGAIAVELEGADGRRGVVHILAPDDWPSDANSSMHVGDYESWADGCLGGDDYENVWVELRPTLRQVNRMFERYRELTGQSAGKSLRSPRSLRRAARK